MGHAGEPQSSADPSLTSAHRDALALTILIAALALLVWTGSAFFHELSLADELIGTSVKLASTALTLNVALILFGWRRYIDLQREGEKRREGERRAEVAATTDALTGLLNRKGFARHAETLQSDAQQPGHQISIISLQIHRLRTIIELHGYEIGDQLLQSIAASILEELPPDSIAARVGGDEFAFAQIIGEGEPGELERQAERLLACVSRPLQIDGRTVHVGAFAGIAAAAAGELSGADLLRRADIARDHAKRRRAAGPVAFDAAMERALNVHIEIEQGIRAGLDSGQFVPFFEPQIDLRSGRIIGFEVLARWMHPMQGIVQPDVFLPVAEEIGVMNALSESVMRTALQTAGAWDPSVKIAVNVSPSQLADGWLAERILRLLTETGFPAERLVIEITESSLFADIELARTIVTSLKNQGIGVALDDFGTGFSSLSHLRSLPFDLLKIDRSFIAGIDRSPENQAIVRAVVTLAEALGVPVVVEGLETETAHSCVLDLGCSVGQGWHFARAVDGERAARLLEPALPEATVQATRASNG